MMSITTKPKTHDGVLGLGLMLPYIRCYFFVVIPQLNTTYVQNFTFSNSILALVNSYDS